MKTVKLTTRAGGVSLPIVSPAPLNSKIGKAKFSGVLCHEITEVPDDVSDMSVATLFSQTADVTWLKKGKEPRYSFKYSELGVGKIITE